MKKDYSKIEAKVIERFNATLSKPDGLTSVIGQVAAKVITLYLEELEKSDNE